MLKILDRFDYRPCNKVIDSTYSLHCFCYNSNFCLKTYSIVLVLSHTTTLYLYTCDWIIEITRIIKSKVFSL